jgi:hypothetical protein
MFQERVLLAGAMSDSSLRNNFHFLSCTVYYVSQKKISYAHNHLVLLHVNTTELNRTLQHESKSMTEWIRGTEHERDLRARKICHVPLLWNICHPKPWCLHNYSQLVPWSYRSIYTVTHSCRRLCPNMVATAGVQKNNCSLLNYYKHTEMKHNLNLGSLCGYY